MRAKYRRTYEKYIIRWTNITAVLIDAVLIYNDLRRSPADMRCSQVIA
ncbi:MAG: hypothetical protein AAGA75_10610 [Cyanobacteria bacterium P01_E01_bin.6]